MGRVSKAEVKESYYYLLQVDQAYYTGTVQWEAIGRFSLWNLLI